MSWFRKLLPPKINLDSTPTRKAVPEGLWNKCTSCQATLYFTDLESNSHVCPKCNHHHRISARTRLDLFFDPQNRAEIGSEVAPVDTLKFKDTKKYVDRLEDAQKVTGESDALVVIQGTVNSVPMIAAAFEFSFLGGSMGSVVGERFARAIEACADEKMPFVCFTASGGARMQEGLLSLMQMAKTTAALQLYIPLLGGFSPLEIIEILPKLLKVYNEEPETLKNVFRRIHSARPPPLSKATLFAALHRYVLAIHLCSVFSISYSAF